MPRIAGSSAAFRPEFISGHMKISGRHRVVDWEKFITVRCILVLEERLHFDKEVDVSVMHAVTTKIQDWAAKLKSIRLQSDNSDVRFGASAD